MKSVFVTGTDTAVGKTVVCGLLAKYLADSNRSVITQKWIQTGSENFPEDIETHLALMGRKKADIEKYVPYVNPYTFKFPASPHLAAALEKTNIDVKKIKNAFNELSKQFDIVIVEGIGGALVPLNSKDLVIDIAKELNLPVIIVAKNKLGAINHTLLTIEAIQARKMKILGIIFNNPEIEEKAIADDNPEIVKTLTNQIILGNLPKLTEQDQLHKAFKPIGDKLMDILARGQGIG